jgi:hypothetical protein
MNASILLWRAWLSAEGNLDECSRKDEKRDSPSIKSINCSRFSAFVENRMHRQSQPPFIRKTGHFGSPGSSKKLIPRVSRMEPLSGIDRPAIFMDGVGHGWLNKPMILRRAHIGCF